MINDIVGLAVIWDNVKGPVHISKTTNHAFIDQQDIFTQIYSISMSSSGKDEVSSPFEVTVPMLNLSQHHVVRVAFDTCLYPGNEGTTKTCFVAFLMRKSIAELIDGYLSIFIWKFLKDFKREKMHFSINQPLEQVNSYLEGKRSLLSSLKKQHRIAVAGLALAGKTTIIKRLLTGRFTSVEPTRGFDAEVIDSQTNRFNIVDLGGQETYIQTLWKIILQKSDVLVYVIDGSDKKKFNRARDVFLQALSWNQNISALLILINKQDLKGAASVAEIIESLDLTTIISDCNIKTFRIFGTSAKTGEGVQEAFNWIAKRTTGQEQMTGDRLSIKMVYIFKKTGIPIIATDNPIVELKRLTPATENALMVSGFYTIIESFIQGVFKGKVKIMEIDGTAGEKYKLVVAEKKDLYCLLVVNSGNDVLLAESIGEVLLDYVIQQEKRKKIIDEARIVNIISPFIESDEIGDK